MFRQLIRQSLVRAASFVVAASLCGRQTLNEPAKSDPLNCGVPACADKVDMFRKAIKGVNTQTKSKEAKLTVLGIPPEYMGCPLDRNELGRSSWDLLHSIAANYPEHPTEQQMSQMNALIEAISVFYPCIHCAVDFQKSIKQSPPR
jgi:FAD-linked sulfhydryl oxidase